MDTLNGSPQVTPLSCENKPFISALPFLPVTTALPGRFFLSPSHVPEGLWWDAWPDMSQKPGFLPQSLQDGQEQEPGLAEGVQAGGSHSMAWGADVGW